MLKYLLDTHIVIYVIEQRPPAAQAVFNRHAGQRAISAITLSDLVHGAEKSSDPARNLAIVEDFRSRIALLDCGERAAHHCGSIRAALEKAGTPIGVNDLHLAAQARSEGLTLVTNNLREFQRVPGLLTDNWV